RRDHQRQQRPGDEPRRTGGDDDHKGAEQCGDDETDDLDPQPQPQRHTVTSWWRPTIPNAHAAAVLTASSQPAAIPVPFHACPKPTGSASDSTQNTADSAVIAVNRCSVRSRDLARMSTVHGTAASMRSRSGA